MVESIRKKFYTRAWYFFLFLLPVICSKVIYYYSRNAGVLETFTVKQTLIGEMKDRARNELEGRTGETDSEAGE